METIWISLQLERGADICYEAFEHNGNIFSYSLKIENEYKE